MPGPELRRTHRFMHTRTHVHVCIHKNMCVQVRTDTRTRTWRTCTHKHMCAHTRTHVHMHRHVHTRGHMCTQIHMHKDTHAHRYTRAHTPTPVHMPSQCSDTPLSLAALGALALQRNCTSALRLRGSSHPARAPRAHPPPSILQCCSSRWPDRWAEKGAASGLRCPQNT